MIVKQQFTPITTWPRARFAVALGAASGVTAWMLIDRAGVRQFVLPPVWAQITGMSRTLVRVVISITDAKTGADPDAVRALQRDVGRQQIPYLAALRIQLRGTDRRELDAYLDQDDAAVLADGDNRAAPSCFRSPTRFRTCHRRPSAPSLERDVKELLGDFTAPPAPQPTNGYLW